MVRALDFYPGGPGSIPRKDGIFFQLCFIPLLRLSCRKMGAKPGLDFIRRKWLHVIINDDFLEKGECYDRALLPSIICLGRLRIASKYIFNLWQLRQGVDSLAQWLEHWIFIQEDRVRFPGKTEYFFSYASFLCYGFHVVRMVYLPFLLVSLADFVLWLGHLLHTFYTIFSNDKDYHFGMCFTKDITEYRCLSMMRQHSHSL